MKFTYQFIKENLRIYNEAKQQLPIISEYETGNVSSSVMRNCGLDKFAEFSNFLKDSNEKGFNLIEALNYKELKQILVENTKNKRFKLLFKNKTGPNFKKLIEQDSQTFDRLLNGRWLTKPGYSSRGRKSWGRRSSEFADVLEYAFVPIMNWIISNEIDTCEDSSYEVYSNFIKQPKYSQIKWYKEVHLSFESVPKKEIELTHNLLKSLVDFIDGSEIDFRKLNSDFVIETFSKKIKNLMIIPKQTVLVCKKTLSSNYGVPRLTEDKNYVVEDSVIQSGFARVMVVDDTGIRNWYDYRLFQDKSFERDFLLSQLGI